MKRKCLVAGMGQGGRDMPPELWHLQEENFKSPLQLIIFTDYISILKKIQKIKTNSAATVGQSSKRIIFCNSFSAFILTVDT